MVLALVAAQASFAQDSSTGSGQAFWLYAALARFGKICGRIFGWQAMYFGAYGASAPSSSAACQAKRGFHIMPRARTTKSTLPEAMKASHSRGLVMRPTHMVGRPDSFLTFSANGMLYPCANGTCWRGSSAPLEISM